MAGSSARYTSTSNTVASHTTQVPPPGKRRITIGGPRRSESQGTEKAIDLTRSSSMRDKIEESVDVASGGDRILRRVDSGVDLEVASTSPQSSGRPFPPTSWRTNPLASQQTAQKTLNHSDPWLQIADESTKASASKTPANTPADLGSSLGRSGGIPAKPKPRSQTEDGPNLSTRTLSRTKPFVIADPPSVSSDEAEAALDVFSDKRDAPTTLALPAPEIAYAHTFHYTQCPHTSPPKSRPLNRQPTIVNYYNGLLAHPPLHLRKAHENLTRPTLHIIVGSCSDCDMSARRHTESQVLGHYTHKLDKLNIQLRLLQQEIIAEHPDIFPKHSKNPISMFALPSTLELLPDAMQAVVEIEGQLNKLIDERNREVTRIWRGFTARWGPGLRIHQDEEEARPKEECIEPVDDSLVLVHAQKVAGSESASSTTSFQVSFTSRTPEPTSVLTSRTSIENISTPPSVLTSKTSMEITSIPPSVPTRSTSRSTRTHTRASSVQDRYSDGTQTLEIDSSVDNVKSRGRMIVDWIRPGRWESKQRGNRKWLSRCSSQHQNLYRL
jgi:hypothetical protein